MSNRPNVIIITTDQMRSDAMGFADNRVTTPNLDQLAAEGTVFTNAFCTNPVCTPSRASILTGRYPHCTGAWNIGVSVKEDELTIGDILGELGYDTVANGKMHFRPQTREPFLNTSEDPLIRDRGRARDGTYYGFKKHHITEDNQVGEYVEWLTLVAPEYVGSKGRPMDVKGDVWVSEMPAEFHQTHWISEKSIETIVEHNTDQPLFMWTSFVDPHHPFNPPRKYADMYQDLDELSVVTRGNEHELRPDHLRRQGKRGYWPGGGQEHDKTGQELLELTRNYYGMITFIDDEIGRILTALEDKKMRDNTIIVFTADHGELLGDHHLMYKGPWFFDALVKVPMIFCGPGVTAGVTTDALLENADILPTILELIRQQIPYGVQGTSQVSVLQATQAKVRDSAIISYDAHDRGLNVKCMVTQEYKLVVFAGEEYGELYDRKQDPSELHNVFFDPKFANVKAELFCQLCHRLIKDQDPLPERKASW